MRIAEVSPPWLAVPPQGYGGIEWVVALLTDGLVERGHDVTLFATGDSRTKASLEYVFESAPGSPFINSLWHDTVHSLFVHRDIARFDLIHQHTVWSGLVAGAVIEAPVVLTIHGSFTDEMRRVYELVADRIWFVAISQNQRSLMPELRYAGVVYNGIDTSMYPFREHKDDFVLFLGRAHPDKGPVRALEAARAAGVPLIMAVKVADDEEEKHWKQEVEPRLPRGTKVLPEISHQQKADLLSRARAVLFPIDWDEPFGLVMTEAMACGTPVIATPRGAAPEVISDGETGFIVAVTDYADRAAEALTRVGQIEAAACRSRVEARFSKDAMVGAYEAVFERIIAG